MNVFLVATKKITLSIGLAVGALMLFSSQAYALDAQGQRYSERVDVLAFINAMHTDYGYSKKTLFELFDGIEYQPQVIEAYKKPAERALSWTRYQRIFVKPKRIALGVQFWKKHAAVLARAEQETGVPAEMIVAIIGVESRFGSHKGKNRVLDSLTTLAFERKKRNAFFKKELSEFLLLCQEQGFDPKTVTGSYAGAMGVPQFIASSYRAYAVDYNQDGKIDLFNSVEDVIGSVANYFKRHGWQHGARVVSSVRRTPHAVGGLASGKGRYGLKPEKTAEAFIKMGWLAEPNVPNKEPLTLLEFDDEADGYYLFGHKNFYVITRYNQSSMYALAAHQLAQRIKLQYATQK